MAMSKLINVEKNNKKLKYIHGFGIESTFSIFFI